MCHHGSWIGVKEAVHLMPDRKQKKGLQERENIVPNDTPPVTYFLQLNPTFCLPPPPQDVIIL
jgi:hypothetical protein